MPRHAEYISRHLSLQKSENMVKVTNWTCLVGLVLFIFIILQDATLNIAEDKMVITRRSYFMKETIALVNMSGNFNYIQEQCGINILFSYANILVSKTTKICSEVKFLQIL